MEYFTIIMIVMAVFACVISTYFQCCACMRDRHHIYRLTAPIYPDIIVRQENDNTIPVANGIRVDTLTEDLEIIMAN